MLTQGASFGRRRFLAVALTVVSAAACRQPPDRAVTPTLAPLAPQFAIWTREARAMLSDALETLRTFDTFQAFRVSTAQASAMRLASELVWDAPTSAAWDEATHVTHGFYGRADQLFQAVTAAMLDASQWRQQRAAADAVHDLVELAEPLMVYRDRVAVLPPGDAGSVLPLLDKAWAQWDTAAARWGVSRSEPLGCGSG